MGFQSELDRTYISEIERGVRNPTLKIKLKIAEALKVEPHDLLERSEQIGKEE